MATKGASAGDIKNDVDDVSSGSLPVHTPRRKRGSGSEDPGRDGQGRPGILPVYIFIFVLAFEYIGVSLIFPPLSALHLSLAGSFVLLMYIFTKANLKEIFSYRQAKLVTLFLLLTMAAVVHAFVQSNALRLFEALLGYYFWMLIAYYVLDSESALKKVAIFYMLSHAVLSAMNLDILFSATRSEVFTSGYFLRDGNDFSWGMNVALPFAVYTFATTKNLILKGISAIAVLLIIMAIFGTQSRGATLALVAASAYYWFYISKRKAWGIAIIAVVATAVLVFAPPQYFERMETLKDYHSESSAMGRIRAWNAAIAMANDHPVLGVGAGNFNSAYGRIYRPPDDPSHKWISAHSIYFIVLAEYGYLGVFVLLALLVSNIKTNNESIRILKATGDPPVMAGQWPAFLNMSIIAYAVGGMFLGGINYPHIFVLTGITIASNRLLRKEAELRGVSTTTEVRRRRRVRESD